MAAKKERKRRTHHGPEVREKVLAAIAAGVSQVAAAAAHNVSKSVAHKWVKEARGGPQAHASRLNGHSPPDDLLGVCARVLCQLEGLSPEARRKVLTAVSQAVE